MTPAGGGGLLSGASVASKGYWKDVRVVGAEPAGPSNLPPVSESLHRRNKTLTRRDYSCPAANDLHQSFYSTGKTWHPAINPPSTICDGLLTATGSLTFPTILQNVRFPPSS